MEDTAPTDAAFHTHGGEKPSQRSVRAKTTDVLYAGIEYETPNASVAGLNFVLGDDAVWWNTDSSVSGSDVLRIEPKSGRIVSTIPLATARAEQLVRSPDGLTPTGMAAGAGSIWLTMSIFFSSTH